MNFSGIVPDVHHQKDKQFENNKHPAFFNFYDIGHKETRLNRDKQCQQQIHIDSVPFQAIQ
jgi:hypothetical protein